LKSDGTSLGDTSAQARGVDTGAFGRRRTENGAATVWANPFLNGSR